MRHNPALNISFLNSIVIPPDTSHLTKVAKITFDRMFFIIFKKKNFLKKFSFFKALKSKKSSQNYGKIVVRTNNTNFSFHIDFNADLHRG